MRNVLGPVLGTVALSASLAVLAGPSCVTECRADEDCAPPFFRCLQNTCAECLISDDCEALYGERRQCYHGMCCNLGARGCWTHQEFEDPNECAVDFDCTMAYGFPSTDVTAGGCDTNDQGNFVCAQPAVCDTDETESSLFREGEFAQPPPFARYDEQCRIPVLPFCLGGSCSECRVANDCLVVSPGATYCCPSGDRNVCKSPAPDGSPPC